MFFDFTIWRSLVNPYQLGGHLQESEMRGYRKRVIAIFLAGILLFALREIWGLRTEHLTPLLTSMTNVDYTLARYASLFGVLLWAFIYMAFHYWGVAYILHLITSIPYKLLLPVQLLVTGLLLAEKFLIFFIFALKGEAAAVSFLSFGPLANTFLENWYLILFLNQLTITAAIIISLQYRFIRSFPSEVNWKRLLPILLALHIIMALLTAAIGFIPIQEWLEALFGRGAGA